MGLNPWRRLGTFDYCETFDPLGTAPIYAHRRRFHVAFWASCANWVIEASKIKIVRSNNQKKTRQKQLSPRQHAFGFLNTVKSDQAECFWPFGIPSCYKPSHTWASSSRFSGSLKPWFLWLQNWRFDWNQSKKKNCETRFFWEYWELKLWFQSSKRQLILLGIQALRHLFHNFARGSLLVRQLLSLRTGFYCKGLTGEGLSSPPLTQYCWLGSDLVDVPMPGSSVCPESTSSTTADQAAAGQRFGCPNSSISIWSSSSMSGSSKGSPLFSAWMVFRSQKTSFENKRTQLKSWKDDSMGQMCQQHLLNNLPAPLSRLNHCGGSEFQCSWMLMLISDNSEVKIKKKNTFSPN